MHIEIQNCFSFWGASSLQIPYRGFAPGPHWVTSVPRPPAQDVPHILYQVYAPAKWSPIQLAVWRRIGKVRWTTQAF